MYSQSLVASEFLPLAPTALSLGMPYGKSAQSHINGPRRRLELDDCTHAIGRPGSNQLHAYSDLANQSSFPDQAENIIIMIHLDQNPFGNTRLLLRNQISVPLIHGTMLVSG